MLFNYLKTGIRALAKSKISSLINLAGLTLGITACLAIYVVVSYELSYDTFHPDKEHIYRLVGTSKSEHADEWHPVGFVPNAVPAAMRDEVAGIEKIAAFHNVSSDVLVPLDKGRYKRFEDKRRDRIIVTEPEYFDIFSYDWLAGDRRALSEPFRVVLSEERARSLFGDLPPEGMLGKELVYHDSVRVMVAGIVNTWTHPSDLGFTDFISFATIKASQLKREINLNEWEDIWSASQAYVTLPAGTRPEHLRAQFESFGKVHYSGNFKFIPALQPLSDVHFNSDYQDNYSRKAHLPTLYGLMGIAGFILLVAAINFINLSTAQSMRRAKETGVRKVMGSSRGSLVLQFLTETALITVLAIIVSVLLLRPVLGIFESFVPGGLAFDLFKSRSLLFLVLIALGTILLSGLYPALALSSWKPVVSLKGVSSSGGRSSSRLRRGLIVFQFVVSLIFIAGTMIVGRQLNYMREKDLGFSSDAVVSVRIPWNRQDKAAVFTEKLKQQKCVQSVTKEWFPPMGRSYMVTRFKYLPDDGNPSIEMDASAKIGDANFIPFYQLRLLAGRNYAESDSLRELVINETFSKALGFHHPEDAIGEMLEWQGGKKYPVVGVVADFHEQSFHEKIEPAFIGFYPQNARNLGVKLNTEKGKPVGDAVAQMEKVWQSVYTDQTFAYSFLDESIAQLYEKELKTGKLVNVATVIAILISCMGLLGLIAFTSEQRTKEIGIRKVLGASVISIVSLLTADFVRLVLVALAIASPVAWWLMNNWLDDFAYRIEIQWWMFVAAGLAAVLIAVLTVSWQAIRAAMANPVESLRAE